MPLRGVIDGAIYSYPSGQAQFRAKSTADSIPLSFSAHTVCFWDTGLFFYDCSYEEVRFLGMG